MKRLQYILILLICSFLFFTGMEPYFTPSFGDVDKSFSGLSSASGNEIIITTPSGALLALKQDRTLLNNNFPYYPDGKVVSSSPVLFDYDGDAQLDIAFFAEGTSGDVGFYIISSQASNLYSIDKLAGVPVTKPLVGDFITNSQGLELIYSTGSQIDIYNLSSRSKVSTLSFTGEKIKALTSGFFTKTSGQVELIGYSDSRLFVVSAEDGMTNFTYSYQSEPVGFPLVGDFNNDNSNEIAMLFSNGDFIVVFPDGTVLKSQLGTDQWNGYAFGDFDGDGNKEFVVVTAAGQYSIIKLQGSTLVSTPSSVNFSLPVCYNGSFLVSGTIGGSLSLIASVSGRFCFKIIIF